MSLIKFRRFFIFFLCLGWIGSQTNLSAAQVSISSLGPGYGYAINNSGHAVGTRFVSGGSVPFLYRDGAITELGNLGGDFGDAWAINDAGLIAGGSENSAGLYRPFSYQNGVMTGLPMLPGTVQGTMWGINNAGQLVGYNEDASTVSGVLHSGGNLTDLSSVGIIFAVDINNQGQVVGDNVIYNSENGNVTTFGTLGGSGSTGLAINDLGVVVGISSLANEESRAFQYQAGQLTNLGTLGGDYSMALGINNAGQIVGKSATSVPFEDRAFLYQGGSMIDLNTLIDPASGWFLFEANGINDQGQIVGTGIHNGQQEGFLLTLSIPEPSTVMVLSALSLVSVGLRRRRCGQP